VKNELPEFLFPDLDDTFDAFVILALVVDRLVAFGLRIIPALDLESQSFFYFLAFHCLKIKAAKIRNRLFIAILAEKLFLSVQVLTKAFDFILAVQDNQIFVVLPHENRIDLNLLLLGWDSQINEPLKALHRSINKKNVFDLVEQIDPAAFDPIRKYFFVMGDVKRRKKIVYVLANNFVLWDFKKLLTAFGNIGDYADIVVLDVRFNHASVLTVQNRR
jgi:hypothetical protein